jgi:hypothetical protein
MAEELSANTTITFQRQCEVHSGGFSLEINEEDNLGKTSFAPGDTAYLRCYPGFPCKIKHTAGSKGPGKGSGLKYIENECITIVATDSATTQYFVASGFTGGWIGTISTAPTLADPESVPAPPGTPISSAGAKFKIDGWELTFPNVRTGIFQCSYYTSYSSFSITCMEETPVLITAERTDEKYGEMFGSITVDFTGEVAIRDVYITIKDACTRQIVSGASVFITTPEGELSFTSDDAGRVFIEELQSGMQYPIVIRASGYKDSNQDRIHNDYIEVEG